MLRTAAIGFMRNLRQSTTAQCRVATRAHTAGAAAAAQRQSLSTADNTAAEKRKSEPAKEIDMDATGALVLDELELGEPAAKSHGVCVYS